MRTVLAFAKLGTLILLGWALLIMKWQPRETGNLERTTLLGIAMGPKSYRFDELLLSMLLRDVSSLPLGCLHCLTRRLAKVPCLYAVRQTSPGQPKIRSLGAAGSLYPGNLLTEGQDDIETLSQR